VHKHNKFSAMPFRIPEVALNAFRACKTHRFLYVLKIKTRKYRVRWKGWENFICWKSLDSC